MADEDVRTGYGSHPTIYGHLSDDALYAMYRQESWQTLDETCRQQLLQETVNRAALENGEIGSCRVAFTDRLDPTTCGEQGGGTIWLNREMYVYDRGIDYYHGHEMTYQMPDVNMRALTTVLHEDQHAYQNQVIAGEIAAKDLELARQYMANDIKPVVITDENGNLQIGMQYMTGEIKEANLGYYMYYLQSTERDAYRFSEEKTSRIMEALTEKYGDEASFQAYRNTLEKEGYQARLAEAKALFQNENIEKDLNQTLLNVHEGTNVAVDKNTENLVLLEMKLSYENAIAQKQENGLPQTADNKGESKMAVDWANMKVTQEEFNQQMHDAVNAYYEHAMNDPGMSKDEAIASTGEMAERAEAAMEEFAAAEAANAEAAEAANAEVAEDAELSEGDELDGGEDQDGEDIDGDIDDGMSMDDD